MNMKKQVIGIKNSKNPSGIFSNFPLGKKAIIFLGLLVILSSFVSATLDINDLTLFAYYDFEQSSTSKLLDQKDNGNILHNLPCTVGTPSSQQTALAPYGDYSWYFGSGNVVCYNNSAVFQTALQDLKDDHTISVWVKQTASAEHGIIGLGQTASPNDKKEWLTIHGSQPNDYIRTYWYSSGGSYSFPGTSKVYNAEFLYTVVKYANGTIKHYVNTTEEGWDTISGTYGNFEIFSVGSCYDSAWWNSFEGYIDDLAIWNKSLTSAEISEYYNNGISGENTVPPTLLNINCTSCNVPYGDNESPYTTDDTTPTFTFKTNEPALCRIADENLNYSSMNSSRDCSSTGSKSHTCTLKAFDELKLAPTDYVYIGCKDYLDNENITSSSGPLEVQITSIAHNSSIAIERGITTSIPSATIYTDQQVYVRTISNEQALATFDKVALYGSQRWAFNYISTNESSIGTFYNLSPVFYAIEMENLTMPKITDQVGDLINTTKT